VREIEEVTSQVLQKKLVLGETIAGLWKENEQLLAPVDEKTAALDRRIARLVEAERVRGHDEVAELQARVQGSMDRYAFNRANIGWNHN
jgi:hypothetical protein